MYFSAPSVLWALLALAIPIVIHFFSLRRYQVLPFSNTQFIKMIQTEQRTRSILKRWLLLVLRLLVIAFVVLAFARPFKTSSERSVATTPYVAVYIDNSYSMDANGEYGVLIDWAKIRARELADAFPPQTKFLLTTNEFDLQQQRWVDKKQFISWVQNVGSTHLVANVDNVLRHQSIVNRDTQSVVYTFLFTDLHKPVFESITTKPQVRQKLFLVPLKNNTQNNVSVDSVWFVTPSLYVGKLEELMVRIHNHSNEPVKNSALQIFINDTLKNTAMFSVEPQSTIDVKCSYMQETAGWNTGYVSIQDYPITFDNQLFFSYEVKPQNRVLLISEKQGNDYFATLFANDKSIVYNKLSPLMVVHNDIANYQLVIVDAESLSVGLSEVLVSYVEQGGRVVLLPSKNQKYRHFIKATGGIALGEWVEQEGVSVNLRANHILFKDAFAGKQKDYILPTYKGYFATTLYARQYVDRLIDTESGDLFFYGYKHNKGTVYVLATEFLPSVTNFMKHPIFVPLFYNMTLQSTDVQSLYTTIKQGVRVSFKSFNDKVVTLNDKNGKTIYPSMQIIDNNTIIEPKVSDLNSGAWSIEQDNQKVGNVAFNFDRSESCQDYVEESVAVSVFKSHGFDVEVIDNVGNSFAVDIASRCNDEGLWKIFVLLALVCLFAEAIVARYRL